MFSHSKSLLVLLQRYVAVRQLTLSTRFKTRESALSDWCGFIQQRAWTSATRTTCLQRLSQPRFAVQSSKNAFCTKESKAGEMCGDEYPSVPCYRSDSEPETREAYIVLVNGFAWSCSAEDLLHFFSDCRIRDGVNGIHLTRNTLGSSRQAFIEVEDKQDVIKALEKHRQYLGSRYVEVYEVTDKHAEIILKKGANDLTTDWVVRLRGIPFSSNKDDIAQFFSGLELAENGITMVVDHIGRNSGEAFVQFLSQESTNEALQRDRWLIGNRYIEVFPSTCEEIYSVKKKKGSAVYLNRTASQTHLQTRSHQDSAQPLHCIHMRGLPFQASGEDIVKFFSPLGVSKILIEYGPDGKVSGEADVYFNCHQDATDAMSRDKDYIGGRYIELYLNS